MELLRRSRVFTIMRHECRRGVETIVWLQAVVTEARRVTDQIMDHSHYIIGLCQRRQWVIVQKHDKLISLYLADDE